MRQVERGDVGPALGVAAIMVTFVGIFGGVALSPAFAWSENALSNLGDAGHPAGTAATELLFNGGLILGGLLGISFAGSLAVDQDSLVVRVGALIFAMAMASMAGVGLVPQDQPYHFEVAAGLYLLFTVAAVVFGTGNVLGGNRRAGVLSVALGLLNLAIWVAWAGTGGIRQPGLAIPEILGAGCIGAWALFQARRLVAT